MACKSQCYFIIPGWIKFQLLVQKWFNIKHVFDFDESLQNDHCKCSTSRPLDLFYLKITFWKIDKDQKYRFHQKIMIFDELWQNCGDSENIQEICYLERCLNFLYDLFLLCAWPAAVRPLKKPVSRKHFLKLSDSLSTFLLLICVWSKPYIFRKSKFG